MAITQAICNSFKQELLEAIHNFKLSGGDTFKIALYAAAATLDKTTTAYSATNEITNTAGTAYTAGGATLTRIDPFLNGDAGILDFADVVWGPAASFTARGALIYNASDSNKAVAVFDFGSDKTVSNGTFTIAWPVPDVSNALIRLGP